VRSRALVVLLAAGVVSATPLLARGAANDGWVSVRAPVRPFEVKDLQGHALRSQELVGKVVVIDFWATWCSPCIRELPELAAYHKRLEGSPEVALLSFNVTDEPPALAAFLREKKVSFPVYPADALVGPFELVVFPTKLVVDMRRAGADGGGVVRFRREGFTPVEGIEARVAAVLAEKP